MASPQASRGIRVAERRLRLLPVGVIVLVYLVVGVLWIFASGPVADMVTELTSIPRWIVELGKGVLFVAVTAVVLQLLLRRRAERLDAGAAGAQEDARRLTESEAQNRLQATALSGTANAVVITGRDGTIEWVNAAFEQMSGYPSSVAVGATPRLLKSGLQDESFYRQLWETVLAGQVWQGQVVNRRSDGELYTVRQTITPVFTDSGELQQLVAVHEDISERVVVARELEASSARLQALFEHALDAIMLADDQGRYLEANPAGCQLLGYSRDELLGMRPADLAAPDHQPAEVASQFEQFVQAGAESGTFALRHKDGHVVETEYRAVSNIQPGVHLAVLRDVTVRNGMLRDLTLAEARSRELAENNEELAVRLAATLESITDGLCTLDEEWRFTYLNAEAERLLRQPREELLGREIWEPFAPTIKTEFETALRRAMTEQVTVVLEEYHYPPLDSWFQVVAYPSPDGLTVYLRDAIVQHRDRQELRRINDELSEANLRLEDAAQFKDDLLSMASHELRTPLTPILGFLEILQVRGNLTTDQQQMLKVMGSNAKRMLRLVDDLLVVSRASAGALVSHPEEVSVEEALSGVLDELGEVVGVVDVVAGGGRAMVDPQHLEQIVMNLLTNASKYGRPPVTVTAKGAGEGRIAIEVADHGAGIAPDFREHMWDRFVQSDRGDRRTASGVGLGLPIVRLLAEANNGTVSYRDGSPTGAVFTVELTGSCEPAQTQTGAGSNGGEAVHGHGGTRVPRPDGGSAASPQPLGVQRQGSSATTVALPARELEGATVGGELDPEEVVAWATRQLLHVESRDEAAGVVLRVIQRLGGWTTPAKLADVHALPLDVSFGLSDPILPVAPPHSIERMHLERHLPAVVEDARRAIAVVGSVSRLRHAASMDPLTGLANRRGIDRLLARGCSGAAVVMFDLDGFKQVNDQHGHAAGDHVLQSFGRCLREELRAGDHAGRLGGDEFIAILQDTDEIRAQRFVDRLRQAWQQVRQHQVGFSAGITEVGAGELATDAVQRADAAMYGEKAAHHTDGGKR